MCGSTLRDIRAAFRKIAQERMPCPSDHLVPRRERERERVGREDDARNVGGRSWPSVIAFYTLALCKTRVAVNVVRRRGTRNNDEIEEPAKTGKRKLP